MTSAFATVMSPATCSWAQHRESLDREGQAGPLEQESTWAPPGEGGHGGGSWEQGRARPGQESHSVGATGRIPASWDPGPQAETALDSCWPPESAQSVYKTARGSGVWTSSKEGALPGPRPPGQRSVSPENNLGGGGDGVFRENSLLPCHVAT